MSEVSEVKKSNGVSVAGMILGISSIVFSVFLGFLLGIVAIVLSAIGLKRSERKGMAIAGLVTGIVGLVLSIGIGIAIIIVAYAGVQQRANDSSIQAQGATITKEAELYDSNNGEYPNYNQMEAIASGKGITIGAQGVGSNADVIYIPCYGDGGIIWYWNSSTSEYGSYYAGETSTCEWN